MNPTDQNPANNLNVKNPLNAMRPGEVVICEIKRHPIGLVGIYSTFSFLLIIILVVALIAPDILTNYDKSEVYQIGAAVFLFAAIFAGIFSLIARTVYRGNRWILTSDSLTQISQVSLFNKQSSQLSLGNLEDITVLQDGVLTHMFNYGMLRAETAGERSKFSFMYCPDPNAYAQKILVARETFEQGQLYADRRPDHTEVPNPAADSGVNINTQ